VTEAVVVGGGHNGLTTAFYLARAGIEVTVLEAQDTIGGACKTEELIRGYKFSTCATTLWWLRARVAEDMGLFARGLIVQSGSPAWILEGNRSFVWWRDEDALRAEIARFSSHDAHTWTEWTNLWKRAADLFGPFLLSYPPTIPELFKAAERTQEQSLLELLLTHCLADLADRHFESPEMRNSIRAPHDIGSLWDHGSALAEAISAAQTTYSETGSPMPQGYVLGGMGRVTDLMRQAAEEAGATIRTNARVAHLEVEQGRVVGVELANGEQVVADLVISNADPKRTFLQLLDEGDLPDDFVASVRAIRTDIAPLKFHCALSQSPEWFAFGDSDVPMRGTLRINPSRESQERAWDDARNGRLPAEPYMVAMTPSAWDPSLAPAGHHTVSFWTLFAPVRPAEGTWPARREEMTDRLLRQLDRYSPNFRSALVDCLLLTPSDLEERVLLTDGNIHHVDMVPSQMLWQRPLPELARYRSPILGLYLCGAGQHPGGEISGAPGHNAAHAVLDDLGVIDPGSWEERHKRVSP
jgi:phytoene dehydrogenase-like protein